MFDKHSFLSTLQILVAISLDRPPKGWPSSFFFFLPYGTEVEKVDINMEGQRVLVTTSLSSDEVLAALKKTGRETSFVGTK